MSIGDSIKTHYTTEDIIEETLQPHPALRDWVEQVEVWHHPPTETEAMRINVIVRQQNLIYALVLEDVRSRRTT